MIMKAQSKRHLRVQENSNKTEIQTLTLIVLAMAFLDGCSKDNTQKGTADHSDKPLSSSPEPAPPLPPAAPLNSAASSAIHIVVEEVDKKTLDDHYVDKGTVANVNLTAENVVLSSGGGGPDSPAAPFYITQDDASKYEALAVSKFIDVGSTTYKPEVIDFVPKTYLPPPPEVHVQVNTASTTATTLNVTTSNDIVDPSDGFLSLREAIAMANASNVPVTINLPSDFYGLNSGELDIADNKNVTINIGTSTLASLGNFRYFEVGEGASLTIIGSNIGGTGDIVNSGSISDNGAAVYLHANSSLVLDTVTIFFNITTGKGGAIYAENGSSITLENNSFINSNQAADGGGIYRDGAVTIFVDGSSAITSNTPNDIKPVVLDLTGNGIHLISPENSPVTLGDLSGSDNQQRVGWIMDGQGVLMLDTYGNGKVMDLNQISFVSYTPGAKTDLQGLIAFDTNHDGLLDVGDKNFNQFGVLLTNGKFESLSQLGIVSISLISDNHQEMMNGNTVYGYSSYKTVNGASFKVADTGFAISSSAKGPYLHFNDVISEKHSLDFSKLPEASSSPTGEQNVHHAPASALVHEVSAQSSVTFVAQSTEHLTPVHPEVAVAHG